MTAIILGVSLLVGTSIAVDRVMVAFQQIYAHVFSIERIQEIVNGFLVQLGFVIIVPLIVCAFLIFNAMSASVSERKYEAGVLRSLGASRRQVFWSFFYESLLLGVGGSVIGVLGGLLLSNFFIVLFQNMLGFPSGYSISNNVASQSNLASSSIVILLLLVLLLLALFDPVLSLFFLFIIPIYLLILPLTLVVYGIAAGLVTALFGGFYPAISACKVDVAEALRVEARTGRRYLPDAALWVIGIVLFALGTVKMLFFPFFHLHFVDVFLVLIGVVVVVALLLKNVVSSFSTFFRSVEKIVFRNIGRKLLRSTVCFSMIGISISSIIMLGGLQRGVFVGMEEGVRESIGADMILQRGYNTTEEIRPPAPLPSSFVDNLTSLDNVELATSLNGVRRMRGIKSICGMNMSVGVVVIDPNTFQRIVSLRFVSPSPSEDQVYELLASTSENLILPQSIAKELGVSVGQNVSILTKRDVLVNYTVVGIFAGTWLQFFWVNENPISDSIIISYDSETKYFNGENQAWVFLVNVNPDYKRSTSIVLEEIDASYPMYSLKTYSVTLDDLLYLIKPQINWILLILLTILYFALLIATIGIALTMIMNVRERRREIGILRSQGMSRSQLLFMFLIEATVIGLMGFVIGLPCGLILLQGLVNISGPTGFWIPFVLPWGTIIQALGLSIFAAVIGALYPAYKASKTGIVDALGR